MSRKSLIALALAGCFALQNAALAGSNSQVIQGSVVYAPVGITMTVVTSVPINSEILYSGYVVNTVLPCDFAYNGKTIAPMGSTVTGSVISAKKAGRAGVNGQVYIRFNQITTPQGFRIPISAVVLTEDGTGLLKGGTKFDSTKDYSKNVAIGGGLDVAKVITNKGEPVEIPSNAAIELYFDQPITIGAPSGYEY